MGLILLSVLVPVLQVYGAFIGAVPTVTWGGPHGDFSNAIDLLPGNQIVIGGTTNSFGTTRDGFLATFDGQGNLVWDGLYMINIGIQYHEEVADLEVYMGTAPFIFAAGTATNYSQSYGFLMVTDTNGFMLCDDVFTVGSYSLQILGLGVNTTGYAALVGFDVQNNAGYIALYNGVSCKFINHKYVIFRGYETIFYDAEFTPNYIVVSGHVANASHAFGLIMIFNMSLIPVKYVLVNMQNQITIFKDVEISNSSNIIVTGWTGANYVYDVIALNLTMQLTINWANRYDYKPFEEAYGLDVDSWGGIYIVGRMDGDLPFDYDASLIKVFPNGTLWIAYKFNSTDIEEAYDVRAVVDQPMVSVTEYVTGNLKKLNQTLLPIPMNGTYVNATLFQSPMTYGTPQYISPPYTSSFSFKGAPINNPVDREAYIFVSKQKYIIPEFSTASLLLIASATLLIFIRYLYRARYR